jgi:hypothetical protein
MPRLPLRLPAKRSDIHGLIISPIDGFRQPTEPISGYPTAEMMSLFYPSPEGELPGSLHINSIIKIF